MTDTTPEHDPCDTGKDGRRYPLTAKQELFSQLYVETGNASEAFRQAYPGSDKWAEGAVWSRASGLLMKAKVKQRVFQLQAVAAERHVTTLDSLTLALREAGELAHKEGQAGAAVQAVMGEAKLHGHLVDRHEDVTPLDEMPKAELTAHMAELDRKLIAAMSEADLRAHEAYLQGQLVEVRAKLAGSSLAAVGAAGGPNGAIEGRDALPSSVALLKVVED